jgi:arginine decarboxylase
VLEKPSELDIILEESTKMGLQPSLGIRVRLASQSAGKWQDTGGEKSKFGFSAAQVLTAIERLRAVNQIDILQLVHFHLGSQVANINDIHRAMRECARFYAELHALNVHINIVDVGGGLGIDYDGTHSRSFCSTNYTMQEYANTVVYALREICEEKNLPHPQIITESGRAMVAHHAVLITNVIDVESITQEDELLAPAQEDEVSVIHNLWDGFSTLSERSALEAYHDACYWMTEVQSMYVHGVLNLTQRARAEKIYYAICFKVRELLQPGVRSHREVLDELNGKLADKYFCNFSLFQSLPDAWAIDQIFPIVPLSGLDQKLSQRGVLQDVTCDSDGRIKFYVDGYGVESTLPLPPYSPGKPYLLGIFLVGAYQEILGDLHNLFGDTDSVHVEQLPDGKFRLVKPSSGDTVESVLRYVHFEPNDLLQVYHEQLAKANLTAAEYKEYLETLVAGLKGYTYFED